jgi:hypothetical protein
VVISKSAGEVGHLIRSVHRLLHPNIPRKPAGRQTASRLKVKAK